MLRTLFSLCSLLLSIATIILLHTAEVMDGCPVGRGNLGVAYVNAVVWMAMFLFVCLPFLRSIAKMIYVNAFPALLATVTSFAVLYVVNSIVETCPNAKDNLLLTSMLNALLALLLLVSELGCRKRRTSSYEELES